jgi:hypothetical protein
VQTKV